MLEASERSRAVLQEQHELVMNAACHPAHRDILHPLRDKVEASSSMPVITMLHYTTLSKTPFTQSIPLLSSLAHKRNQPSVGPAAVASEAEI